MKTASGLISLVVGILLFSSCDIERKIQKYLDKNPKFLEEEIERRSAVVTTQYRDTIFVTEVIDGEIVRDTIIETVIKEKPVIEYVEKKTWSQKRQEKKTWKLEFEREKLKNDSIRHANQSMELSNRAQKDSLKLLKYEIKKIKEEAKTAKRENRRSPKEWLNHQFQILGGWLWVIVIIAVIVGGFIVWKRVFSKG